MKLHVSRPAGIMFFNDVTRVEEIAEAAGLLAVDQIVAGLPAYHEIALYDVESRARMAISDSVVMRLLTAYTDAGFVCTLISDDDPASVPERPVNIFRYTTTVYPTHTIFVVQEPPPDSEAAHTWEGWESLNARFTHMRTFRTRAELDNALYEWGCIAITTATTEDCRELEQELKLPVGTIIAAWVCE